MAIFQNEAIRSLPEQVEKNKEDIKEINDLLENLDPSEINNLNNRVGTLETDMSGVKAEQVVQNTAIGSNTTAINNEKTAREDVVGVNVAGNTYLKTATPNKQILIDNNGLISITSSTFVEALASNFVRLATDNTSVKADENNGVIIEVDGDNPKTLTLKPNGDFEVDNGHILKFDTTGAITIDGQPIGTKLYKHNISFKYYLSTGTSQHICFNIINNSNTPLNSQASINTYLYNNGFTADNKLLEASGTIWNISQGKLMVVHGITRGNFADRLSAKCVIIGSNISEVDEFSTNFGLNGVFTDNVVDL